MLVGRPTEPEAVNMTTKMSSKVLGVVVVGFGRIGKVRVRDIQQKLFGDCVVVRAVVSR